MLRQDIGNVDIGFVWKPQMPMEGAIFWHYTPLYLSLYSFCTPDQMPRA